jgi:hypothetical protein
VEWCEIIPLKEEDRKVVRIDPNLSPFEYLLARMRDPTVDENRRDRIAMALLPFTAPKLAVTANVSEKDFGEILDRRIAHMNRLEEQRRKKKNGKVIEAKVAKAIDLSDLAGI